MKRWSPARLRRTTPRTDGERRILRIWLMLGMLPFALAALVVAVKLISVNVLAGSAIDQFERRTYAEAAGTARGLEIWNWTEPWKGPYNVGTSLAMQGSLDEARAKLEEALELHGEPDSEIEMAEHCVIIASLVTTIEKQGDAAREGGDTQAANAFYGEALAMLEQAPEGCMDPPRPGEADTQAQFEAAVPRIEEKIEQQDGGGGDGGDSEGDTGDSEDDGQQTPEEQLEEQNQDAQEEQQQQDDYYQQGDDESGGGGGVDRPW